MSESTADLQINLPELVNLAAHLLYGMFQRAPREEAKSRFKEIKAGAAIPLGKIRFDGKLESSLSLKLDYSEFKGPGFNFDLFNTALARILEQISEQFRIKGDLNVMQSAEATMLIHLPGMVEAHNQLNVMALAFEMANLNHIVVKLMFLEPDQYEALRRQDSSAEA